LTSYKEGWEEFHFHMNVHPYSPCKAAFFPGVNQIVVCQKWKREG